MSGLNIETPAIQWEGTDWRKGDTAEFYYPSTNPNAIKEFRIEACRDQTSTEITFRNVGDKNPNGAIQFVIKECKRGGRAKLVTFSIPKCMVDAFLDALQTEL